MSKSPSHLENISFAVGTGRCGTKFMYRILDLEPQVASVHERNPLNEAFHRYCKWYKIPIDHDGFLYTKQLEIKQDLEKSPYSFEASAHLSLSIIELYERFNAKFLLLVRSPEKVINSYIRKGWYETPMIRTNPDLPPSYQDCKLFHHFLGRIMPSGDKFLQWNQMTRVGKLAWFWNALNAKVIEQFEQIPTTHWRIEKLENLSYRRYLEIAEFLGIQSQITASQYDKLAESRPNALSNVPKTNQWNSQEIAEFEAEIVPLADKLGYESKVKTLLKTQVSSEGISQKPLIISNSHPHLSPKDVTAIIRSVGERTEKACYHLLSQQVPQENIIIINEVPFSAALAKSFKIGIERDLPWTLCIDADVLIKQNAVKELLSVAEQLDEKMFGIQGLILCKFFGGLRGAGNRLYRTSLLPQALDCIPQQETIRPESDTILNMEKKGYGWKLVELPVGLHDYEQYYKDIYRKCFIQAHKHHYFMQNLFEPLWTRLATEDPDFQVALWGLQAGQQFEGEVQINSEQFSEEIDEFLKSKDWQEKKNYLSLEEFSILNVQKVIKEFILSSEYIQYFQPRLEKLLDKIPKKQTLYNKHGDFKGFKFILLMIVKGLKKIAFILENIFLKE